MQQIFDIHCHHFALSPTNGGYVNPRFAKGIRMRTYAASSRLVTWRDAFLRKMPELEKFDELYRANLIRQLDLSRVTHAAVLAFDGAYDSLGRFDYNRTSKAVSNDAVIQLCRQSTKMLFCASVNPYRRDWLDELNKCIESGAVMMKWLPNVMGFDPADPHILPFYDRLKMAQVPLLMHVGFEYAAPNINLAFSGLDRLEAALKTGVTVVAAHCCGGRPIFDNKKLFRQMRVLVESYPNLYLDVAAMASFHRKSRFINTLADQFVRQRLVYGSDFPIPIHAWAFRKELKRYFANPKDMSSNYFDRDITLKLATGLDEKALSRGYKLLQPRFDRLKILKNSI